MIKRYKQNEIDELSQILKNNGVISVPTDTVYGICSRIDSKKARDKLMKIKNRPVNKNLPIMCANIKQIENIAILNEQAKYLMEKFMPGPITLILKKNPSLQEYINNGGFTIAIRMATSDALKELIIKTGCPLFMSSANQSGEETCTSLDEIEQSCPTLDGMMEGSPSFGMASTIVDCTSKTVKILREGPITYEAIKEVLGSKTIISIKKGENL